MLYHILVDTILVVQWVKQGDTMRSDQEDSKGRFQLALLMITFLTEVIYRSQKNKEGLPQASTS